MGFYTALAATHGTGGFPDVQPFPRAQQESLLLPQWQTPDRIESDRHQALVIDADVRLQRNCIGSLLDRVAVIFFVVVVEAAQPAEHAVAGARTPVPVPDLALQNTVE